MLGKLLRINLSRASISEEKLDDAFFRKYLGGSGFIAYFLLKELLPRVDPLGFDNKLIFATGPVTGTTMIAGGRNGVGAKSPLTGGWCESNGGGSLGPELKTAGSPSALRLTPDRTVMRAAYGDLVYVTVEIVDAEGVLVRSAVSEVSVDVAGVGQLVAMGTADPTSEEVCAGQRCRAFEGRLLAIVSSTGEAGEIFVRAGAEGLIASEVGLHAR